MEMNGNEGWKHYSDVIMSTIVSQITSLTIIYSTVCSGTYQRKHQSSASLAFVRGIHRWPVNSPHKGPVTRKMFPLDDGIMIDGWVGRLINTVCEIKEPSLAAYNKLKYILEARRISVRFLLRRVIRIFWSDKMPNKELHAKSISDQWSKEVKHRK